MDGTGDGADDSVQAFVKRHVSRGVWHVARGTAVGHGEGAIGRPAGQCAHY